MARFSIKNTPVESSVEGAMESGFQTLEELKDEISEGVENQRDHAGIAATQRFQTLEETVSTLEEVVDNKPEWCPSIDTDLSESIRCNYRQNYAKGQSRAARHGNAIAALSAAVDGLRSWAEEQGDLLKAIDAGTLTKEDQTALGDRTGDDLETQIDEANELADAIDESIGTAENAEFPGMRG